MKVKQSFNRIISSSETAQILGISVSSVRNWVKHGFISSSSENGDSRFFINDVMELKGRIERGELERLNSRANKIKSSRTFLPDELFKNSESKVHAEKIADYIRINNLDVGLSMFVLSINLLNQSGLLMRHNPNEFIAGDVISEEFSGNSGVIESINAWRSSFSDSRYDDSANELLNFHIPYEENILGAIYQSVLQEGEKSKLGSYYTPDSVVNGIIERMCCDSISGNFLDPCCGTGQFLLSYAGHTGKPEEVYGIDIDHTAVNIARINLILKFPERDFFPKIFCNDSLQNYNDSQLFCNIDLLPKFDVIATNPPWGYHYSTQERRNLSYFFNEINSGESFSYFLVKSMNMLKHGGRLSFVLPESVLNVDIHSDIRKYILDRCAVKRIEIGRKIFKKVFSSTVIIDIKNSPEKGTVKIVNSGRAYDILQSRFEKNNKNIFDIQTSQYDEILIKKAYEKKHIFLTDTNVRWGLGIVTGDNTKWITSEPSGESYEPIIKGRDIVPFGLKKIENYIEFMPERFQQCIAEEVFRSPEKLIYKYISGRLVFTSDTRGHVTLNSANIMIPEVDGISIYFYEGLFNSNLYNFIFARKFSSVKVLKGHLKGLPIPVGFKAFHDRVVGLVQEIKSSEGNEKSDFIYELNEAVYEFFKFSKKEIEYIDSISGI